MTLDETEIDTSKIRRLNDRFRCHGIGPGMVVVTRGILDQGHDFAQRVHALVRSFDGFSPDNDPHGEHDFGTLDCDDQRIFWKIDYYDQSLVGHSVDAADEAATHRVLTIMLASEY